MIMNFRSKSIITAPLVSEQFPSGVAGMAEALLNSGIEQQLNAKITSRLAMPEWQPKRDPETKILNPVEVRDYSMVLAHAVRANVESGYFPIVLGGDCT